MSDDLFSGLMADWEQSQVSAGRKTTPRVRSDSSLARTTDPAVSHAAAARAKRWIPTHEEQILGVMWRPLIAAEIAKFTGLTVVQVDRRMPELQAAGNVRLTGRERDGFREWTKVLNA